MLAAALTTFALVTPAAAQNVCGERNAFMKQLGQQYHESPAAIGLASNGSVLEVLTSEKGSWTILVTDVRGTTCMVATGESWEDVPKVAMGPTT